MTVIANLFFAPGEQLTVSRNLAPSPTRDSVRLAARYLSRSTILEPEPPVQAVGARALLLVSANDASHNERLTAQSLGL